MSDILLVFHPFSGRRPRHAEIQSLGARLEADGHTVEMLATVAGAACVDLISRSLGELSPQIVVAAGGDGTVRDVVEALLRRPLCRRPSVALVPMGTANNAARAIDASQPRRLRNVANRLSGVVAGGVSCAVDVGRANGRPFLGSVAIGMDADILAWRNAHRSRVPGLLAGYPLYLASCAVNAFRGHGGAVRLLLCPAPGDPPTILEERAINVLVTNTALHAGEFRFAGGSRHDDGRLDVLWNGSMRDYLRRYAAAWPRHLRALRGRAVRNDAGLTSAAAIVLEWERPMAWQLDGEEREPAVRFEIDVLPAALRVLVA